MAENRDAIIQSTPRVPKGPLRRPSSITSDAELRNQAWFGALFGIALTANYASTALNYLTGISGLFPLIMVSVGVVTFVMGGLKAARPLILGLVWMTAVLLLSVLFVDGDHSRHHAIAFLVVGLPGMLIGSQRFSLPHALIFTQVIGMIGLPYLLHVFGRQVDLYDAEWMMGLAYACLPVAFSGVLVLVSPAFHRGVRFIAGLNVVAIAVLSMQFMSRGVFLSVGLFVVLLWFRRIFAFRGSRVMRTVIDGCVLIFVIMFAASTNAVSAVVGKSAIFQRFAVLSNYESLNGRSELWNILTIPRGMFNLIFGSGAGSFEALSGGAFPHSLFGEVYFELGLVAVVVLVIWLIRIAKAALTSSDPTVWRVLALILAGSVLRLSVSYTFWLDVGFWLLVGFTNRALSKNPAELGPAHGRVGLK